MDFQRDIIDLIESELISFGICLSADDKKKPLEIFMRYAQFSMRRITQQSRVVHISTELATSQYFQQFNQEIVNLKIIAESGGDLTPYQSKKIETFDYSEHLLFDWGIQHLHLGLHTPGQPFSVRTGPLLFAIFGTTDAYFISILDHGKWGEIDLLNIVDNEWPQLIQPFVLPIHDIDPVPTEAETIEARKHGLTVIQKLASGKCIAPPGGGLSTATTSIAALDDASAFREILLNFESEVRGKESKVLHQLGVPNGSEVRLVQFSIHENVAEITAVGTRKKLRMKIKQ